LLITTSGKGRATMEGKNIEIITPEPDILDRIAVNDVAGLRKAEQSYGDSWKKRGGVGAFMMLARKMDRMENHAKKNGFDIFKAIISDNRAEGVIDDIRDLRRYLILVEAEMISQGFINPDNHRDNK